MSSNVNVNDTGMSGVYAFIAGYCECEQKMLLIHRPATLIFSYLLMRYRVNDN